mmetsp:Transcript_66793/g.196035  ORF Transcript_66793/g.196035 Transcript_66793/m.196035 type:complete len:255 (+) Transcript_66793:566-1330(+)
MKAVMTESQKMPPQKPRMPGSSSSSSSPWKRCVCVLSWKQMNRQYRLSMMAAMKRDRLSTALGPASSCVWSRMEGRDSASTAVTRRPLFVTAAVLLNCCSLCLMPPTRKAEPRTRSRFDSTDPSIVTCTKRRYASCVSSWTCAATLCSSPSAVSLLASSMAVWAALRDMMLRISSVMLPNVAFNRPPTVSFVYLATSSVTKETRSAKGMSASIARQKVGHSPHFRRSDATANGVAKRRMFILLPRKSSLSVTFR